MKKVLSFLFYLVILYSLMACSDKNEEKAVLFESLHFPGESAPTLSSLFSDHYTLTTLETDSVCLIGRIDKIVKHGASYYILSNGETIFHFNQQGKFISSLDRVGQGPEEYHRIEDFDVYDIAGNTEVWISDNISLKRYDANDFSFKEKIQFPFVIHKFKRMQNSTILLVTGQREHILTVTDSEGQILSEYQQKEIPFLMFRPIQFIPYQQEYLFQLGIANAFISFNPETARFTKGFFCKEKEFLSDQELLDLFEKNGMDFIREANKKTYINTLITCHDRIWVHIFSDGQNYLSSRKKEGWITSAFSADSHIENDLFCINSGAFISTITTGSSDDSILLYIEAECFAGNEKTCLDKNGNEITLKPDDNPVLLEFY